MLSDAKPVPPGERGVAAMASAAYSFDKMYGVPRGAGKGCDFYLGRFPLASADFWTSDHLSERSRMLFRNARARAEHSR